MTTIITHAAVGLAMAAVAARRPASARLWIACALLPVIPDLDTPIGRWMHPNDPLWAALDEGPWGHRGASHSLVFAAGFAALTLLLLPRAERSWRHWLLLFVAMASHGAFDALTNGGSGIAFLWPFSIARCHAPWRPIEVAPLSVSGFFTERGWEVFQSELLWVWAPGVVLGAAYGLLRRRPTGVEKRL